MLVPLVCVYGARTASGWMSEFRNQNTFGLRRFVSHGVFWIVLAVLNMFAKRFSVGRNGWRRHRTGSYCASLSVPPVCLFQQPLASNVSLIVTFVLLLATFVLLTIGDLQGGPEGPVALYVKVGGYLILATAAAAWYVAAADVINDAFGRTVFPLERVGKRTVNL